MTKLEMALMIIAATMFILMLLKLFETLALRSLNKLLDRIAGDRRGVRMAPAEAEAAADEAVREKPPDAQTQAHADEASRAPMVRMAAETLRRRRSEALE